MQGPFYVGRDLGRTPPYLAILFAYQGIINKPDFNCITDCAKLT